MAQHLARKAEAVLMVALTLQLAVSVASGSARPLLRGSLSNEPAPTGEADRGSSFGLQHPGLSSQAYGTQDFKRRARSIRMAEEKYEDWTNLQDGYEAELRLHSERRAATTSGVQLLAVSQPTQQDTQHTVVHRPLFPDQEVPKRDAEAEEEEDNNQVNAAGQHTVDPEDIQDPEDNDDEEVAAASTEDIHSLAMEGTVALSSEIGRRRFARKLLFDDGTHGGKQPVATAAQLMWPRRLQQLALSSPFGAMGPFSGASDPVQMSSA